MPKTDKYILDNEGNPVAEPDLMKWAEWMEHPEFKRSVRDDTIEEIKIRVSTVFLGLDHAFAGGKPLLFETMTFHTEHEDREIFGRIVRTTKQIENPDHEKFERYSTRAEAIAGHERILKELTEEVSV